MIGIALVGKTMSSREIAELTGKEHKNVMADIRSMLEQLNLTSAEFSANLPDSYGRGQPAFCLPKDLTITLVSGYSVAMRHRIVTRWQELEAQAVPALNPANLSRMQLIEMAMQAEQERLVIEQQNTALEHQVESLTPKAEALDRIATSDGSMPITNAAKDLQMRPKDLFAWLKEHRWIYRRPGGSSWLAYQDRIHSGHLEHKVTTVERGDGSEKVVEQVLVTAKGLVKLAKEVNADAHA